MYDDVPSRILLAGGFTMLFAGITTGVMMSRMRATIPETPKYLRFAHLSGYMQAPILFGLVIAVAASDLPNWLEILGASLVTFGAVLLTFKDLINHSRGVEDEFRQKGPGYYLGAAMVPAHIAGLAILAIGALA